MSWPTGGIPLTAIQGANPGDARADIHAAVQAVNAVANSRGAADGVASLDAGGKVPVGQVSISSQAVANVVRWAGAALTVSAALPSGGTDGDVWAQVSAVPSPAGAGIRSHVRGGGSWVVVQDWWVRVGGSWKRCKAVFSRRAGAWKAVHVVSALPAGAIIPWLGGAVPAEWEDYSAANGRFVIGAGGALVAGAIGGSETATVNVAASSAGEHTGTGSFAGAFTPGGGSTSNTVGTSSEGAHGHAGSFTRGGLLPSYREYRLIRATGNELDIPQGGGVFSVGDLSATLTNIHAAVVRLLRAAAADGGVGGDMTYATGVVSVGPRTGGSHAHGSGASYDNVGSGSTKYRQIGTPSAWGGHGHTFSTTFTIAPKRRRLALWEAQGAPVLPPAGSIIMWAGATVPTGWRLCDGSGGTPDMRGYFVEVNNLASAGSTAGDNGVTGGSGTTTSGGAHSHQGAASTAAGGASTAHTSGGDHTHSASVSGGNYTPPYYALAFLMRAD